MSDTPADLARLDTLEKERRFVEGLELAGEILARDPTCLDAILATERLHVGAGRLDLALDAARRAVDASPYNSDLRRHLAGALSLSGWHAEAVTHLERLARDGVADPQTMVFHGVSLRALLRYDEAVAVFRAACDAFPDHAALHVQLASTLNYAPGVPPETVFAAHRRFGELLARTCSPRPSWRVSPDPRRPLRIGILSGDLRTHSVAFFLEPLLEHADRERTAYHCFSTSPIADGMTERLRSLSAGWHAMADRAEATIAHKVLTEKIDVLVDLGGLSGALTGPRIMSLRCAPVQVTYIGYPNTTGLRTINARMVDSITDPPGSEALAVEALIRLDPCFLCYRPPAHAPAPPAHAPAPAASARPDGGVVFGSFNNILKLNDPVIALWARVVNSVPGSRLLLKDSVSSLDTPRGRESIASKFQAAGLAPDRLDLFGFSPELSDHLRLYERIDVALDPFPYNGTTTTCDALWMGVPVITLRGNAHAGRVGASLLSAAGLNELVATSPEQYLEIARTLGADPGRRAELRASLRDRLRASVLCDGPALAARFERAVRGLWTQWCGERAAGGV